MPPAPHLDLPVGQLKTPGQKLLEDDLDVAVRPCFEEPDRWTRRVDGSRGRSRVHRRSFPVVLPAQTTPTFGAITPIERGFYSRESWYQ